MDYNDIIAPWRIIQYPFTGANYYILENGEPKPVASQTEHEAWFKSHSEWLLADLTVKGARLRSFFQGIAPIIHPDAAGLPGGAPALWWLTVHFPGTLHPYTIGGSTTLEDTLCAVGLVLWWLKDSPPPGGETQCNMAFWDLVTAVNAESDRRHTPPKPPTSPTAIDSGSDAPPPASPLPEGIIIPPGTPVIDVRTTPPAKDQ